MRIDRAVMFCAAALLASVAIVVLASSPAPAAARSDVPPFCVMVGGPRGPSTMPQICRFFDYQDCLEASAVLHGNCVVNIDYRGPISTTPAPALRYRRY
jgi:hypothetical protein